MQNMQQAPLPNPLVGISTALAVSTVVAITQILTLSHLDWWLTIAVWCFATALPLLIAVSINPIRPLLIPQGVKVVMPPVAVRDFHVFLLVCAVDIVGFALIFFHFGLIAGCLFCVFSWIGLHRLTSSPIGLLGKLGRFVQTHVRITARHTRQRLAKYREKGPRN